MSQLLSISFDAPTSPALTLGELSKIDDNRDRLHGWGFGWYTENGSTATVIKDPEFQSKTILTKTFNDWKRFQSTIFLCHLRGAAKRYSEHDTQPFSRTYAGRSWIFSHNGDLNRDAFQQLSIAGDAAFEPVGTTDSEHAFCWLLKKMENSQKRTLRDTGWNVLYEYFQQINSFGTANIILCDGHDMVVYQDMNNFNSLYWCRQCPPHQHHQFTSALSKLEFDVTQIIYRTYIIFANEPSLVSDPIKMHPGQMLACRRGQIIWDSHAQMVFNTSKKLATEDVDVTDNEFKENKLINQIKPAYSYKNKEYNKDAIILKVSHMTKYTYEKPVESSKHYFRLHPVNDKYQRFIEYRLQLSVSSKSETFDDVFGNRVTLVEIDYPYSELTVTMEATLSLIKHSPLKRSILHTRSKIPLLWMPWQRQMMLPYLLPPELPESQLSELTDFAMSFVLRNDYDVIDSLLDMNYTIYRDFKYTSGSTNLETTPFDVFLNRRGVCQDFANLFICLARLMGIPARYRVGYIFTGADYTNKKQSEASHAWLEIYLPWLGWRGFDPTNGSVISQDHIRVACGRNYFDATPTSGTLFKGGGNEQLIVSVKVERE